MESKKKRMFPQNFLQQSWKNKIFSSHNIFIRKYHKTQYLCFYFDEKTRYCVLFCDLL